MKIKDIGSMKFEAKQFRDGKYMSSEQPAEPKTAVICSQCAHFKKSPAFEDYDGQCLAYMDHARSDDPIAAKCKGFELIAASSPIGNQTKFGAVEIASSPAAQSVPSLNMNSESKGFDWTRLNTNYNDFPHLFLLGKPGAGKSYVSDRLVRFLDGYAIVIKQD